MAPELDVNIKLEALRGGGVQTFEVAAESEPPDVIFWDNRVFRYQRTDGVWDQKKHVYRESTARSLSKDGSKLHQASVGKYSAPPRAEPPPPDTTEIDAEARKLSLSLTAGQLEQLKRVRERGGYPSSKAALVAGLELLERGGAISNDALLNMLSKRLRGLEAAPVQGNVVGMKA